MTVAKDIKEAYERELGLYPGVEWEYGHTKRHNKLVLRYQGQQRTHVFACSSGDRAARHAGLSQVRQTLRALGAEKRP